MGAPASQAASLAAFHRFVSRSALHWPTQCAASGIAMRCDGHRTALPLAGVLPAVSRVFVSLGGFASLVRTDDGAVRPHALINLLLAKVQTLENLSITNREEAPCLDASSRLLFAWETVTALWQVCLSVPPTVL